MAKACLTVRKTFRAGTKVGHSDPVAPFSEGYRLTDKSYARDNRLMILKSPNCRNRLAPRCRLILSWVCSEIQGYVCSTFKKVRELGLERRETVWSLSTMGV